MLFIEFQTVEADRFRRLLGPVPTDRYLGLGELVRLSHEPYVVTGVTAARRCSVVAVGGKAQAGVLVSVTVVPEAEYSGLETPRFLGWAWPRPEGDGARARPRPWRGRPGGGRVAVGV